MMMKARWMVCVALAAMSPALAAAPPASDGPQMVDIPAGRFVMGAQNGLSRDYYNERPAHDVTISRPFRIAAHEVTIEEWRRFKADMPLTSDEKPYVAGISWTDAVAYADWLSKKTGRAYRLPTEAEWEYVARLAAKEPTRYGTIAGLKSGPREWTLDWFGPYPVAAQTDPTGAASGSVRVVRGGRMGFNPARAKTDPEVEIDYGRPEVRLAFPPSFAPYAGAEQGGGFHSIGLRLVEGPTPRANVQPVTPPIGAIGVRQDRSTATMGPDPSKPYFRRRIFLPAPPDNAGGRAIDRTGWDASFRNHHHSPGIAVMPNGDVLIAIYTSYREYEAGTSIIATRLRHGADEWDEPSPFADIVGVNDHAPLLMTDGDTIRFFWGNPYSGFAEAGIKDFPFLSMTSADNGASWSDIRYPRMVGAVGAHNRQPVNTAFRDSKGRLLLSSDGAAADRSPGYSDNMSLLWASEDDGKSWYDTGGRTHGRHTTFVEGKDGRILAFGGKNTDIDGFMPLGTSTDGGKTYVKSKLPFPALSSGQRPQVLRLKSGRLLMIGDYVRTKPIAKPLPQRGSYVAVSSDDGKSWTFKALPGVGVSERADRAKDMEGGTVGYVGAAQGPDGIIHVVTTATFPTVALAFNEAWLDAPDTPAPTNATLERNGVTAVTDVKSREERYADGTLRGRWSGGQGNDGALIFDGPQRWYYPDGKPAWQVDYRLGRKVGIEKRFDATGRLIDQWDHKGDGRSVWTRWWSNGAMRSMSGWKDKIADGRARTWSPEGKMLSDVTFVHGNVPGQPDLPGAAVPGITW